MRRAKRCDDEIRCSASISGLSFSKHFPSFFRCNSSISFVDCRSPSERRCPTTISFSWSGEQRIVP